MLSRTTLLALSLAALAVPAAAATPPGKLAGAGANKTIGKPLARVVDDSAPEPASTTIDV